MEIVGYCVEFFLLYFLVHELELLHLIVCFYRLETFSYVDRGNFV
jgi:hypothetical protein